MRLNITPEPAVLGFLLDGPVHGYELYKQVNGCLGAVWRVSLSQLYAIVKTFEMRGWIETQLRTQETRPSQKVLKITSAGRQAFADWLDQPAHGLREFRVDFFLRLYFARSAGPQVAEKLVSQQIAACERELESLQARGAEAGTAGEDLNQLIRSFRIQQLIGIIQWLEKHQRQLGKPLPTATTGRKKQTPHRSGSRQPIPNTLQDEKKQ